MTTATAWIGKTPPESRHLGYSFAKFLSIGAFLRLVWLDMFWWVPVVETGVNTPLIEAHLFFLLATVEH